MGAGGMLKTQILDALDSLEVTAVSDPSFRQVSHVTQVAKVTLIAPVILVTLITSVIPGVNPFGQADPMKGFFDNFPLEHISLNFNCLAHLPPFFSLFVLSTSSQAPSYAPNPKL